MESKKVEQPTPTEQGMIEEIIKVLENAYYLGRELKPINLKISATELYSTIIKPAFEVRDKRIKELEIINEQHRVLNGKLRTQLNKE